MSDRLLVGLDRSAATHLAAVMARSGLHDLTPWDSPDHGWTDPLNNPETRTDVRSFLGRLFREAMESSRPAEANPDGASQPGPTVSRKRGADPRVHVGPEALS